MKKNSTAYSQNYVITMHIEGWVIKCSCYSELFKNQFMLISGNFMADLCYSNLMLLYSRGIIHLSQYAKSSKVFNLVNMVLTPM